MSSKPGDREEPDLTLLDEWADQLHRADVDAHIDTITDRRLIFHVRAGRVQSDIRLFIKTAEEMRRRSFSKPVVWAAAWLAHNDPGPGTKRFIGTSCEFLGLDSITDGLTNGLAERACGIACRELAQRARR